MMKEGIEVEWTATQGLRNGGIKISQKKGKVISINGNVVIVKPHRGIQIAMLASSLHFCGSGPNQLTQALMDAS